jgi:hypothetical protein
VALIAAVAREVLGGVSPVEWQALQRHCHVREMISRIIPGYEEIGSIDQSRREFHVKGRTLHQARFPTPTGRTFFAADPLTTLPGTER